MHKIQQRPLSHLGQPCWPTWRSTRPVVDILIIFISTNNIWQGEAIYSWLNQFNCWWTMWFGDRWKEDLDPNEVWTPGEIGTMGMETIFWSPYVCLFDGSSKEKIKRWSKKIQINTKLSFYCFFKQVFGRCKSDLWYPNLGKCTANYFGTGFLAYYFWTELWISYSIRVVLCS